MMAPATRKNTTTMEATVTSKGQVTLPKELRKRLGVQRGSRIRFKRTRHWFYQNRACAVRSRRSLENGRSGWQAQPRDDV